MTRKDFSAERTPLSRTPTAATRTRFFCIHSYAGESGPPCGWRGAIDIFPDGAAEPLRCPRCRRLTLLALPAGEE